MLETALFDLIMLTFVFSGSFLACSAYSICVSGFKQFFASDAFNENLIIFSVIKIEQYADTDSMSVITPTTNPGGV